MIDSLSIKFLTFFYHKTIDLVVAKLFPSLSWPKQASAAK